MYLLHRVQISESWAKLNHTWAFCVGKGLSYIVMWTEDFINFVTQISE